MSIQLSVRVRNARGDALETTIGASPKLRFYSGAKPANCAAARSGTLIAEIALPADWLTAASAGVKSLAGTWAGVGAAAAGAGSNVGHYAIMDNAGTNCDEQGDVTITGGGGDMTLDNINIATGQAVTVTSFTHTEPQA